MLSFSVRNFRKEPWPSSSKYCSFPFIEAITCLSIRDNESRVISLFWESQFFVVCVTSAIRKKNCNQYLVLFYSSNHQKYLKIKKNKKFMSMFK